MNGGNLLMFNCTISENFATANGYFLLRTGGIADSMNNRHGTTYARHCTIFGNTGPLEILAQGNFQCENTILGRVTGVVNSQGHNLIFDTSDATITNNLTGNIYNVDPQLFSLQNNGGPTYTMALGSGSPALNQAGASGLLTDQRGVARLVPDIGAYEASEFDPPTLQIILSAPGEITLFWPSSTTTYILQEKADLLNGVWADVNVAPVSNGTTVSVTLSTDNVSKCYRLRSL